MPKMKTNRGAAKRFKVVSKGKRIRRRCAFRNHINTKMRSKTKRGLRKSGTSVDASDIRSIKRLLRLR